MSLYTGILNEFEYWKKWSDEDFRNEGTYIVRVHFSETAKETMEDNWKKPRSTQSGQRRRSLPSVSGWRTQNGSVPSISRRRARSPVVMCRAMTAYESKQEMAAGMGVLPR